MKLGVKKITLNKDIKMDTNEKFNLERHVREYSDALLKVIDYLYEEESDYESHLDEGHPPENHIYHYLIHFQDWLSQRRPSWLQLEYSIQVVIDYLVDEKEYFENYTAMGYDPEDHIYHYIQIIQPHDLDPKLGYEPRRIPHPDLKVVGKYQMESENPKLWESFQKS